MLVMETTLSSAPALTELGLALCRRGAVHHHGVGARDSNPCQPSRGNGQGRPPTRLRRDTQHQPVSVKQLALRLAVFSLEGDQLASRQSGNLAFPFCGCASASCASRLLESAEPHPEEWLLIEWPQGEAGAHQILVIDFAAPTSL